MSLLGAIGPNNDLHYARRHPPMSRILSQKDFSQTFIFISFRVLLLGLTLLGLTMEKKVKPSKSAQKK